MFEIMDLADIKNLTRLYVAEANLAAGAEFSLSDHQHHYLRNVMRVETGDYIRVFNGRDGEWFTQIKEINKKNAVVVFLKQTLEQKVSSDILILCSPIKKEAFELIVEKATELGAAAFQPVICKHTVVHRVNEERAQSIATEASEQCERLDVMTVKPLTDLKSALKTWDRNRKLIFCIERSAAPLLTQKLVQGGLDLPLAILIGPEGGFSRAEIDFINSLPFVESVSLGSRILRAETALITALSAVMLHFEK